MFENEHMFCSCSHLHNFCATGGSSGLATRVILTRMSRGGWESLLHMGGPASDFIFVPYM
jgi:hypothetical protein